MTLPTVLLGILAIIGCVSAIIAFMKLATTAEHRAGALARADEAERENNTLRDQLGTYDEKLTVARKELTSALTQEAKLTERVDQLNTQFDEAQQRSQETFDALAAKALASSNEQFLKLAKQTFESHNKDAVTSLDKKSEAFEALIKPIGDSLKKANEKIEAFDKSHAQKHATLTEQMRMFAEGAGKLRLETSRLANALRKPQVRGRYGEVQLERVVELAGMRSYCDFSTQTSSYDSEGNLQRPDLVVSLPNGRSIAVDAKTNIDAYLDAIDADDTNDADTHLNRYAKHVAEQAVALSKKKYWANYDGSPEFVIMFVPGDQFVDAALERRPDLLDFVAQHSVIIASPSTLIGLLRAVHVGWRENQLSESAHELFSLGTELHERTAKVLEHAAGVGKAISTAQEKFNKFVGSVDTRLLPTLRKFEDKGAKSSEKLTELKRIDGATRTLQVGGENSQLLESEGSAPPKSD